MACFWYYLYWILIYSKSCFPTRLKVLDKESCNSPLGMQNYQISNNQLTASSIFSSDVGPHNARLHTETGGGAWCPDSPVDSHSKEYLEIDLIDEYKITGILLQGRYGRGSGKEYTEYYRIHYWRKELNMWRAYRALEGTEILYGNTNTYEVEKTHLSPNIVASKLRFFPYNRKAKTVCIRLELLGCLYQDHVKSYRMVDGDLYHRTNILEDLIYDGVKHKGNLYSGLGQLTDGVIRGSAESPFKDIHMVGWNRESRHGHPVEISFKFTELMNITHIEIYSHDVPQIDAGVFSRIQLYVSAGGKYFTHEAVLDEWTISSDTQKDRKMLWNLNSVGTVVKLRLFFRQSWILISEVRFGIESCNCNVTTEMPINIKPQESKPFVFTPTFVTLLVFLSLVFLGLPIIIIMTVNVYSQRRRASNASSTTGIEFLMRRNSQERKYSISPTPRLEARRSFTFPEELSKKKVNSRSYSLGCQENFIIKYNTNPMQKSLPVIFDEYSVPLQIKDSPPENKNPKDAALAKIYTIPCDYAYTNTTLAASHFTPKSSVESEIYCEIDLSKINIGLNIPGLRYDDISFLEHFGSGKYGNAYVGQIINLEKLDQSVDSDRVIIKTLEINKSSTLKDSFFNEIKILSNVKHPNLACILAVIITEDPVSMLLEYSDYGDLSIFLSSQSKLNYEVSDLENPLIDGYLVSYNELIYIASQVASGMCYLEANNYVHRDLAARNCMIGPKMQVKVSNFCLQREYHKKSYYSIDDSIPLPIRWLSPETLFEGVFSVKSDVWAYGVTFWEILTLCSGLPYHTMSDDEVINNTSKAAGTHLSAMTLLTQPDICPAEVYAIMKSCWDYKENDRPPFWEIEMFLKRKNLDYTLSL